MTTGQNREKIDKEIDEAQERQRMKFLGVASNSEIAEYINTLSEERYLKGGCAKGFTIPEAQVVGTSKLVPTRAINQYPHYFEALGLNVKESPRDLVLVLCVNTARATEVVFELRGLNQGQGSMKLFHVEDHDPETMQEKLHLESPLSIAVSTPTRVRVLHKLKVLDLKRVHRVVIDASFFDHHNHNVLDNKDTIETVDEVARLGALIYVF